jgi:hypothetical protein
VIVWAGYSQVVKINNRRHYCGLHVNGVSCRKNLDNLESGCSSQRYQDAVEEVTEKNF